MYLDESLFVPVVNQEWHFIPVPLREILKDLDALLKKEGCTLKYGRHMWLGVHLPTLPNPSSREYSPVEATYAKYP